MFVVTEFGLLFGCGLFLLVLVGRVRVVRLWYNYYGVTGIKID